MTPLSQVLAPSPPRIVTDFTKGQESDLAKLLVTLDGDTLVCWQHESIPSIVAAICGEPADPAKSWPDDRFDLVWTLSRDGPEEGWRFEQSLQGLLPGDRPRTAGEWQVGAPAAQWHGRLLLQHRPHAPR